MNEIIKNELLQDVTISYYKPKNEYYSHAKLIINEYAINLKSVYYKTLDEAVQGIKERITKAVIDFEAYFKYL